MANQKAIYTVFFDEPKMVQILASSKEQARELFLEGEFDNDKVFNDPFAEIGEPTNIELGATF